eukprot:TRINITY_DN90969_c0_g1_i1.p2 TRINITY_DN90969_c0_g1~~TRINITY_DN90969_c0_g1_i1.p2  ORF type:complete len:177 (+),score=30.24 TRINITY_DN90969_c0_g1_i1:29-532(+)
MDAAASASVTVRVHGKLNGQLLHTFDLNPLETIMSVKEKIAKARDVRTILIALFDDERELGGSETLLDVESTDIYLLCGQRNLEGHTAAFLDTIERAAPGEETGYWEVGTGSYKDILGEPTYQCLSVEEAITRRERNRQAQGRQAQAAAQRSQSAAAALATAASEPS